MDGTLDKISYILEIISHGADPPDHMFEGIPAELVQAIRGVQNTMDSYAPGIPQASAQNGNLTS
jgi:hypothetical protein